ncbi:Vinorine synthase [Handroanthus impetiginosus]|uniref:Vinorine synthase n=1 Tax=Handroanthus impetiginosus TaxID=429701 RepID=A0A2G9FYD5_9LAMI|nr:Vinorine synthase [Handroanthus impetiginosus]
MKIQMLSGEHIRPSSSTPTQLRNFKLSFIDERIPPYYIPLILYYNFNEHKNIKQSEISHRLKISLSGALVQFYPLAGRIKGQSLVECNDEGILYIEANAHGSLSDIIGSPDSLVLDNLVPFKSNGYVSSAGEPLAVQTTLFQCGGISIGICISHRIADGCTLSSFIKYWSGTVNRDHRDAFSPVFNSSTLFPPRNTPDFRPNFQSLSVSIQPRVKNLVTKRFVFTSSAIDAMQLKAKENSSIANPTRVEVLSAFLWSHCLAAKVIKKSEQYSVAYHPVNLRGRIPQLTEHSFGNLFQMAGAENDGETNWVRLVEKLRVAFRKIDKEYIMKLLGEKGFELAKENFMEISKFLGLGNVEVIRFSSYCGFQLNEADFGWGKPVWVSSASFGNRDSFFLFDSVGLDEGIEAWVVMAEHEMERLEKDVEFRSFTSYSAC